MQKKAFQREQEPSMLKETTILQNQPESMVEHPLPFYPPERSS